MPPSLPQKAPNFHEYQYIKQRDDDAGDEHSYTSVHQGDSVQHCRVILLVHTLLMSVIRVLNTIHPDSETIEEQGEYEEGDNNPNRSFFCTVYEPH